MGMEGEIMGEMFVFSANRPLWERAVQVSGSMRKTCSCRSASGQACRRNDFAV